MNKYYVEWKDFDGRDRQGYYEALSITDLYEEILNGIEDLAKVVRVQQV